MLKRHLIAIIGGAALLALAPNLTHAFQTPPGGGAGGAASAKCSDCHNLSKEDAAKLLKTDKFRAQVKEVRHSPIKGFWEIELTQDGKTFIVYVDFSKQFLVEGRFTSLSEIGESAPLKKVDIKAIPLEGAIVYGNAKAAKRVIVFDDPDCPYCAKLHTEMKKILTKRKDVAFFIKMYPLPSHPEAYNKSKAIVCANSTKLLDDAFAGKQLPKPACETNEVDNNVRLAEELGIRGTPAIIFPDGRLLPGYVPAEVLLDMLDKPQ